MQVICELAFKLQSVSMSWDNVVLIIYIAEAKENDLYCKNEPPSN
jgi:hypothetical protein